MLVNIFFEREIAMRVSREQARENRERVVSVSSALFREKGVDGVGIADLMSQAGLTHGGFYKQFESKAQLVEEACAAALGQTLGFWETYLDGAADRRTAFIRAYLSDKHRDSVAQGCLLPALAGEAARQPDNIRTIFARAIRIYADLLAPAEGSPAESRALALRTLSAMVGAVVLARASNDPALSEELLRAVRAQYAGEPAEG